MVTFIRSLFVKERVLGMKLTYMIREMVLISAIFFLTLRKGVHRNLFEILLDVM